MMNMNHIQSILTILHEGSITAAAKKLYISQPALSQSVKQIEQSLGAPIFDRTTTPISLTAVGQKYVDAALQILDIDRNLKARIAEMKDEVFGRIRIGISMQRGQQLLPQVIPAFCAKYPFVKIDLIENGSATLERLTEEGLCDIALVTTNIKPNKLHYALIESERIVLMASRNTAFAQRFADGEPISILDAKDERFVSMAPGHSVRTIQERLFETHGLSPSLLIETRNMEAAKRITAHSGAVMLIPNVYVSSTPAIRPFVQCHPILNNDYERHFCLCFRKGLYLPAYMRDFARMVCAALNVPCCLPEQDG